MAPHTHTFTSASHLGEYNDVLEAGDELNAPSRPSTPLLQLTGSGGRM